MKHRDGGLRPMFHSRLPAFHWQAIETGSVGLGIPDSNFHSNGVEGWVEFKQTETFRVDIRPEQAGWILRRRRAGGRVLLAIRRTHEGGPRKGPSCDELWIFDGQLVREIMMEGIEDLPPLYFSQGGPSKWDWTQVARVLTSALDACPHATPSPAPPLLRLRHGPRKPK